MNFELLTNPALKIAAATLVSAAAIASLAGCAGQATQQTSQPSATPEKSAGVFTKDVSVCVKNETTENLAIAWDSSFGVNTNEGDGELTPGSTLCGEGGAVAVLMSYPDGFSTLVEASNPTVGYPYLGYYSKDHRVRNSGDDVIVLGKEYARAFYAEGESVTSDVEGHTISATRLANNSWVNFLVTVSS